MTGKLAALGIVFVLLASLYSGLSSSSTEGDDSPLVEPISDTAGPDGDETEEAVEVTTVSPTPEPEEPTPEATQVLNRLDCEEIRGTDYFSPQERTWFLDNCVTN